MRWLGVLPFFFFTALFLIFPTLFWLCRVFGFAHCTITHCPQKNVPTDTICKTLASFHTWLRSIHHHFHQISFSQTP